MSFGHQSMTFYLYLFRS